MISKKRKLFLWTVRGGMYLATALTAGLTLFLMVYVLAKGIPNITWELLSTKPSYLADRIGILPDILNTLYIIIYTDSGASPWRGRGDLPDGVRPQ